MKNRKLLAVTLHDRAGDLRRKYCSIGEASQRSGISSKMIRHYEATGLLPEVHRTAANYRLYSDADINQLRFIKRARSLGFSMQQIGRLVSLWQSTERSNSEVRNLTMEHVAELDARIREMQEMRHSLHVLAMRCHADGKPECPILDSLAIDSEAIGT
ncbi:MAG: Cu(I)-responsive transcriptional regulator [Gammaproteobacteria bacterium]|nr:Cu(I)-responsive transcriptional regulator [Gammaproteobacteria bacterium]MDP2141166.1 Cu(I)-responsive transcriptional regulator [Gammaproteobacteria bacterium]MDP2349160.1 Cu(I)-responsive transcriptional regulator [Gammaproteobacteria bacterium]